MKLPASVESWWNSQGGEIARREIAWARRWMRSREGLSLVGGIALCTVIGQFGAQFMIQQAGNLSTMGSSTTGLGITFMIFSLVASVSSLVSLILYCTLFIRMLRLRIWPLFDRHRLRDLLLSGINGASLWPALLVGPLIIWGTISLIAIVTDFSFWVVMLVRGVDPLLMFEPTGEPEARAAVSAFTKFWAMGGRFLATPFLFAVGLLTSITFTAFAARFTLLRPRALPALGFGFICLIFLVLPSLGLFGIANFGGSSPGSTATTLIQFVASPVLSTVFAAGIFWLTLRSLRGEKLWEKLRKHAESL